MPIQYRITKRKDSLKTSENNYIMQAVRKSLVDIDRVSEEISRETSLTDVDVQAVIIALGKKLKQHLADGSTVDLGEMGRYKIGIKGTAQLTPNLLGPKHIKSFHLNYQPSKKMKKWLKNDIEVKKEPKRN